MTTTQPPSSPRILELDALRGIGAAMVVLFHFTTYFDRIYGHDPTINISFDVGYHGVDLFFMISGFVIYMTLERNIRAWDFITSRATRLYPAYWVALLVTFAIVNLVGLPGKERSAWELLANFSMLQQYLGIQHIDGVYWTLTVEFAFYCWMFTFSRLGLLRSPARMLLIWLGVNVLVIAVAATFQLNAHFPLTLALLTQSGSFFFAGIGFYCWSRDRSRSAFYLIGATLLIHLLQEPETVLISLVLYSTFALATTNRLPFLASQPLLYLGAISYPLYLIHQNIGYVIIRQLYAANLTHPILLLGTPIATALILAALIHHLIEVPALRTLRQRLLSQPRLASTSVDEPTPARTAA